MRYYKESNEGGGWKGCERPDYYVRENVWLSHLSVMLSTD